jgi:hypothetical protein
MASKGLLRNLKHENKAVGGSRSKGSHSTSGTTIKRVISSKVTKAKVAKAATPLTDIKQHSVSRTKRQSFVTQTDPAIAAREAALKK